MADPSAGAEIIRIVQVSDTHVSHKRAYFVDNWNVFVDEMRHDPPYLIVHSGDVSFDGAADEDDIAFARAEKDRLSVPWLAIPGNHDIGRLPVGERLLRESNSKLCDELYREQAPIGDNEGEAGRL
jgi:predicted MPP superfamily phosphohydrolase